MATPVLMPKQGQSVETCIIIEWKKMPGDHVSEGETLCDVETDKATLEVVSPTSGTLLAHFYADGDEVPVLQTIAAIGEVGEDASALNPHGAMAVDAPAPVDAPEPVAQADQPSSAPATSQPSTPAPDASQSFTSPRARNLAERKGVDIAGVTGSGPEGRIIERDVINALATQPKLTPVAKAMIADGGFTAPQQGTGPSGRITSKDLQSAVTSAQAAQSPAPAAPFAASPALDDIVATIPLKGVRKVIAERMLASLQSTAQLTLNAYADARTLQSLRKRLKESPETLGLRSVTINDLLLFAVSRALLQHPDLNALLADNTITQYRSVHLGMAVDTPRGLTVPVIRNAHALSLRQLAVEGKRLATAAIEGKSTPDDLSGGTFTVTNLGAFGVDTFTPVLNPPQVAILGVGGINLRPVEVAGQVQFVPHIGLSLTINHQAVDGAPGARFLQTLTQIIANIDLMLAG